MSSTEHFLQFGQLGGNHGRLHSTLILIWLTCTWVLWKEHNNMIFNNKVVSIDELMDKVKLRSFLWLNAKDVFFAFSYQCWWFNLLACLACLDIAM